MNVLKERIAVLRTVTTLLVVTLAPVMLATVSMPTDMIVMVQHINYYYYWGWFHDDFSEFALATYLYNWYSSFHRY